MINQFKNNFVSTSKDRALDAFGINAIQYLVKPVEYLVNAPAQSPSPRPQGGGSMAYHFMW